MSIKRAVPNITTDHLAASRKFYTELLGVEVVMDMDWIITPASPTNPSAQISLLRAAADSPQQQSSLTVEG